MSIDETEPQLNPPEAEAPYLGDAVRDLEERFAPRLEKAREQLSLLNVRAKGFIRQNPGTTLLLALGCGYLIGKLASRK